VDEYTVSKSNFFKDFPLVRKVFVNRKTSSLLMMFEDDSLMITLVVFKFFLSKTVFEGKYGSSQSPKSISISMEHFLLKQHDSCD